MQPVLECLNANTKMGVLWIDRQVNKKESMAVNTVKGEGMIPRMLSRHEV